jgi:DNA-binding protein H-NS
MAKRGRSVPGRRAVKVAPKAAVRIVKAPSEFDKLLLALEDLTVASLRRVIECATAIIDKKTEGERRSFIEEVTARATAMGISLAELAGKALPERIRPVAMGGEKAVAKPANPKVKYRDPKTGATWSGRGRTAKWLVELEAQGKKRDDYAV